MPLEESLDGGEQEVFRLRVLPSSISTPGCYGENEEHDLFSLIDSSLNSRWAGVASHLIAGEAIEDASAYLPFHHEMMNQLALHSKP